MAYLGLAKLRQLCSFLFLVAFLLLVAMPGAPSSVLAPSMPCIIYSFDSSTSSLFIAARPQRLRPPQPPSPRGADEEFPHGRQQVDLRMRQGLGGMRREGLHEPCLRRFLRKACDAHVGDVGDLKV